MIRYICLVLLLLTAGTASASVETLPYGARRARTYPPNWLPSALTEAQLRGLEKDLEALSLPAFAILVRGEDLSQDTPLVNVLDRVLAAWQQQGLPGNKYAILLGAWSEDCAKPKKERRPGHDRCEYALSVGWKLRDLGIQPSQDAAKLAAPYITATSQFPVDLAGGMLGTLRNIADMERQKEEWIRGVEDGSLPRALAALDRTILLAKHFRDEENRESDETLKDLITHATTAREGSIQRITAADDALQTYLNSLIRIEEIQRNRKARGILGLGILLALLAAMLASLGLVIRKRWDAVRSISDPIREDLRLMRMHADAISAAAKQSTEEWELIEDKVKGRGPETMMLEMQTRATLHDLRSIVKMLQHHVAECEHLLRNLPIASVLRAISPCPAQALDRHMRKAFPVALARPDGYSQVLKSDVEMVRLTVEEAEKRCNLLATAAQAQIRALRDALDPAKVRAEASSWCSEKRLAEVAHRAESLGVPAIWYLSHPLKKQDPAKLLEHILALHSVDPTAAVSKCIKLRVAHEEILRRVEVVGAALGKVSTHRVPTILFSGPVQVDAADDPQQTVQEAARGEVALARICSSPENPEDTQPVEAQAQAVVRLYNKALSQYDLIRQAQAGVRKQLTELQEQIRQLGTQLAARMTTGILPETKTQIQLAYLHMQAANREIIHAESHAAENWFARAQRSANTARSELSKAMRCAQEVKDMQDQVTASAAEDADADDMEVEQSGGGSTGGGSTGGSGGSSSGGGTNGSNGSGSGGGKT